MQIKQKFAALGATVSALVLSGSVHAASVLDTATKTAVTAGFTDMKDTVLDLLSVAWPYIIAGSVILATPSIVKSLLRDSTKK